MENSYLIAFISLIEMNIQMSKFAIFYSEYTSFHKLYIS